ncbi:putative membrane protein [Halalkaliarchaeum sp. AArc-CO]|uniref:DUF7471 family protein n=1 Tax=unclassified Halalkaliarchaeum TaxID=2678344 RepID=UPI00217EEB80|nr:MULTISPECIES: hypothetical protein [unclassified Halalkaliarchaeum]MDR5674171.1 hypothetical protein [Halalkaliarchaeum sp. AArc-GB]UWG50892.1 putative membrane protein [Halalkaliarchaeum sp. AArc-CO]
MSALGPPIALERVVASVAYELPESLLFVLALATVGTALVLLLAVGGYLRRRSTPYLLVVIAVAALFARSIVGFGTLYGHVPMGTHHLLEHGFDFLIAVCVLTAVYLMGAPDVGSRTD